MKLIGTPAPLPPWPLKEAVSSWCNEGDKHIGESLRYNDGRTMMYVAGGATCSGASCDPLSLKQECTASLLRFAQEITQGAGLPQEIHLGAEVSHTDVVRLSYKLDAQTTWHITLYEEGDDGDPRFWSIARLIERMRSIAGWDIKDAEKVERMPQSPDRWPSSEETDAKQDQERVK